MKKYHDEYALDFDYSTGTYGGRSLARTSSYGFTSTGYRSPSSWLDSKLKGWDWDAVSSTTSVKARLRKALTALARTVNIVENSVGNGERSLTLSWSKGNVFNHPWEDKIYLDPSVLSGGLAKNDQFAIDYYTGQTLMLSAMKRTLSRAAYFEFGQSRDEIAKSLWKAQEFVKAKNDVIRDWAGFTPYFDVYEQRTMFDQHGAMLEYAQSPMDANVFSTILAWNTLCPSLKIEVEEQFQPFMNEMLEHMHTVVAPDMQFEYAQGLSLRIQEMFPQPVESNQDGDDPSDDSSGEEPSPQGAGGGGSEGNPDASGDTPPSSVESKKEAGPQFIDPTLFGLNPVQTDSTISGGDSELSLNLSDDSLKANNPLNTGDYNQETASSRGYSDLSLQSIGVVRLSGEGAELASEYRSHVNRLRGEIGAIQRLLSFRSTKASRWCHGKEEGELDDGSFHKLASNHPSIWSQKSVVAVPSVAICILVDESGSMCFDNRYEQVRDVTIALTEALKDLKGVHLNVIGHTGLTSSYGSRSSNIRTQTIREGETLVIREFYGPHHKNPYALLDVRAISENLDGYAIEYAAKKLRQDYPHAEQHVVVHISDGTPCPTTISHTRDSVNKVTQRLGVQVYAVGVDNAYTPEVGEVLYGPGHNVVIRDVMGSLNVLRPFLKRLLN